MYRKRFAVRRFSKSTWDTVAEAYAGGKSSHALAAEIGASVPGILYQVRKRGVGVRVTAEMSKQAVKLRHLPDGRKLCPNCGFAKELEAFGKDRSKSDGFHRLCKKCLGKRALEYRLQRTPEQIEKRKEWEKRYRASPHAKAKRKIHARKNHTSIGGRFCWCRNAQKRRGRSWTITREQFAELISKPCTYCGGPLPETSAGLDRLDNSKGYDIENVTPCCALCNYARRDQFTVEEMLKFIGPAVRAIRAERALKK